MIFIPFPLTYENSIGNSSIIHYTCTSLYIVYSSFLLSPIEPLSHLPFQLMQNVSYSHCTEKETEAQCR